MFLKSARKTCLNLQKHQPHKIKESDIKPHGLRAEDARHAIHSPLRTVNNINSRIVTIATVADHAEIRASDACGLNHAVLVNTAAGQIGRLSEEGARADTGKATLGRTLRGIAAHSLI